MHSQLQSQLNKKILFVFLLTDRLDNGDALSEDDDRSVGSDIQNEVPDESHHEGDSRGPLDVVSSPTKFYFTELWQFNFSRLGISVQ